MSGSLPAARGSVVSGVRGHPPARGFREAKTHLLLRNPANAGTNNADRVKPATAAAPQATIAPSARVPLAPPKPRERGDQ